MSTVIQRVWPWVFAFGLGLLLAQGLAPTRFAMALPLSLVPLALLILHPNAQHDAGRIGLSFGFGYFLFGLRWIVEPFQVEADSVGWMAPFALVLLALGMALFWALPFFAVRRLHNPIVRLVVLISAWGLAELARAYVLTGFPWAGLAQTLPDEVLFTVLPWAGGQGAGLMALIVLLPLGLVFRRPILALCPALVMVVLWWVLPSRPPEQVTPMTGDIIRLVQPNAPQAEKWHPEKRWVFFKRLLDLTSAPSDVPVDLVVWPETAVPVLQNHIDELRDEILKSLDGADLLYGIQRREGRRYYNSAVSMDGIGQISALYDKVHLVPFGEYMPFRSLWEHFGVFGLAARAAGGYTPGAERELIELPVGKALILICYEGVFPQDIAAFQERADLMILITNDAWFGSASGPQQHLLQAQMRAAEQRLPMVRVANTGISAMIDPHGRIIASIPLGEDGWLDAPLPSARAPTLYSRTKDWPVLFLTLMMLAGVILREIVLRRKSTLA